MNGGRYWMKASTCFAPAKSLSAAVQYITGITAQATVWCVIERKCGLRWKSTHAHAWLAPSSMTEASLGGVSTSNTEPTLQH